MLTRQPLRLLLSAMITLSLGTSIAVETSRGGEPGDARRPEVRTFEFDYGATIAGLEPGSMLRCWMPRPRSGSGQRVEVLHRDIPGDVRLTRDREYGNRILYFECEVPESGEVTFLNTYRVRRFEILGATPPVNGGQLAAEERARFLRENARVPVEGRPLELVADLPLHGEPLQIGRMMYDRVDDHVRYDKSQPGYGNGDVLWVCDSQFGNCTDFHSLFLSFMRSRDIAARFEIGFPLPPERGEGEIGGYHCWAQFHVPQHGWVPVDISEADKHPEMKDYYFGNLTENRILFTIGRDLVLQPQQAGPPLNYLVYPYAELNDEPLDGEYFDLNFAFRDL